LDKPLLLKPFPEQPPTTETSARVATGVATCSYKPINNKHIKLFEKDSKIPYYIQTYIIYHSS